MVFIGRKSKFSKVKNSQIENNSRIKFRMVEKKIQGFKYKKIQIKILMVVKRGEAPWG